MKPKVSVIITTRNEEKNLKETLDSIRNQIYKPVEIIVSDSKSNDNTLAIAKKLADIVVQKRTNIPQGRNFGAKYATGDIFLFQDADTVMKPRWVEKAVNHLNNGYEMVVGRVKPKEVNLFYRFLCYSWSVLMPLAVHANPGCAGIAVTRDAYNRLNGFDESRIKFEDANFTSRGRGRKLTKFYFDRTLISYTSMRRFTGINLLKELFYWPSHGLNYLITRRPVGKYER